MSSAEDTGEAAPKEETKEAESKDTNVPVQPSPKVKEDSCGKAEASAKLELEPLYDMSQVPAACEKEKSCCLGIDEAGRGPVLGPMVFGVAYWPLEEAEDIEKLGFNDSKQLKEETREEFYEDIVAKQSHRIGSGTCVLSAEYISAQMLARDPISLNALSHNAAIELIRRVMESGVRVTEIYVDAVGNCETYQKKLERLFGKKAKITVKPKADAIYKVVGAASIRAKVTRDRMTKNWQFREARPHLTFHPLNCSGYPGDAATIGWLEKNYNNVFGYPCVTRFSWSTIRKRVFNEEVDEDNEASNNLSKVQTCRVDWENYAANEANGGSNMLSFFSKSAKRSEFFKKRKLTLVSAMPC